MTKPQPLGAIAEAGSLTMADLACVAHVPSSTLARLWLDPMWLDGVTGATLQKLLPAVPGLARYLEDRSHSARLEAALHQCVESGLDIQTGRLGPLIESRSIQYVATALEAAAATMRLDARGTVSSLARCWGGSQSLALDAVIDPACGLISEPNLLIEKAVQLTDLIDTSANSLHTTVGYGILVHKVTKLTGSVPTDSPPATRCSAFAYRSGVIGMLLRTGDPDAARAYRRELETHPLLQRNELWSLATFSADIPQTRQFNVDSRTGLAHTAADVIGDLSELNEAYLHYLVTSAIPVLLHYDSTFGSRRAVLVNTLGARLERGIEDARTRSVSVGFMKSIR
ncbi:hypothetical protein [Nocardia tenerifensis]|uniref:hypothetical protein n=1 Tax=Nocardia tenerifensis TaxID=228006 RepID=UPI000D7624E9|nr:hypothetical protein [Nocardia tenerifensis]